jgi:DNA-directed RNA polymerase specialized sigma24 family protein
MAGHICRIPTWGERMPLQGVRPRYLFDRVGTFGRLKEDGRQTGDGQSFHSCRQGQVMSSGGKVTHWFDDARRGNSTAINALWKHFYAELLRFARSQLRDSPCGAADEEDVVLSAMDSFFHAAQQGRFPDVADRYDLWRLLLKMTARKVIDLRRRERCQRRGGGWVKQEPVCATGDSADEWPGLEEIISNHPTPEFVAKLEGYTNKELSSRFDCSVRTIERQLQLIRAKWREDQAP